MDYCVDFGFNANVVGIDNVIDTGLQGSVAGVGQDTVSLLREVLDWCSNKFGCEVL